MGRITIISRQQAAEDVKRQQVTEQSMPLDYMGDYSNLGIVVDRLPDAVRLLEQHRFELVTQNQCKQIVTNDLQHLRHLIRVFEDGGVDCGFSDLADGIYQG